MQVNIDDFFREQNEAFTVDSSGMDLHWQQMNSKLHAANKPSFSAKYKPLLIGGVLIAIFTVGYFWINQNKETAKTKTEAETISSKPAKKEAGQLTTAKAETTDFGIPEIKKSAAPNNVGPTKKQSAVKAPITTSVVSVPARSNTINKEAKFYIDLTKEPEVFTIKPSIENTITCKQGTTIHIPANLLVDTKGNAVTETVSVIVQEYYRYEDAQNNNAADAGMIKYGFFIGTERLLVPDNKFITIKMKSVLGNSTMKIISNEDAIPEYTLKALNWVSAENFTADKREKIDYKITLDNKFDASTFMSQIAFPKQNVIMAGDIINNSIIFHNVPVGETVYFMSIGKIKDKYFSCSKKLITGNAQITEMDFVEISEALYKQQIDLLNKLGKEQ